MSYIYDHLKLFVERYFYILIAVVLIGFAYSRVVLWDQEGGDQLTYKSAVEMFDKGQNPYSYTVESFENDELSHGYAYLPTLLYVQHFFYVLNRSLNLDIALRHFWKVPVALADLSVAAALFLMFYKKDRLFALFSVVVWLFNPYFTARNEYTLYDPLPVFFLLLSLISLGKKDLLSGVFLAVSMSFKTFGLILLPLYLFKSKSFLKVILGGAVFILLISIPFMRSSSDFLDYIKGSLLVHGERGVQGRPFFTFLSYVFGLPYLQIIGNLFFTVLAIVVPWFVIIKNRSRGVFVLSLYSFAAYYWITPVLNRTHIIWGLPFMLVGGYLACSEKKDKAWSFYLAAAFLYFMMFAYLYIWDKGFNVLWIGKDDFLVRY